MYTQYQQRIRHCFAEAYNFLENHKHARTDKDWKRIAKSLNNNKDPLTVDLLIGVFNELDREYKLYQKTRVEV